MGSSYTGVNMGSKWGQSGVNMGSKWGQSGVKVGSICKNEPIVVTDCNLSLQIATQRPNARRCPGI